MDAIRLAQVDRNTQYTKRMIMTDTQFETLTALLENIQLMMFIGFCFVILGIAWIIGGQR